MSSCRICAKLRRWLGIDAEFDCEAHKQAYWEQSSAWERAHSNNDELWWSDSDQNRTLIEEAEARRDTNPEAAFRMLLEAAEAGSALAMESIGGYYETGTIVAADFDQAAFYYHRAICAGSWMATIAYARLLIDHGRVDECEQILQEGVRLDFIPAYFWLAWFRYERSPTRRTCREIRPLLEHAAENGHPAAKLTIAQLMAKGKFGIRRIPRGLRLAYRILPPPWSEPEAVPAVSLERPPPTAAAQA